MSSYSVRGGTSQKFSESVIFGNYCMIECNGVKIVSFFFLANSYRSKDTQSLTISLLQMIQEEQEGEDRAL